MASKESSALDKAARTAHEKAAPAAQDKAAREEKPSIHSRLNDFLRKYRAAVIAVFAAGLLAVVVAAVWTIADERVAARSAQALETAEASLQEWYGMEPGPAATEKANEILAALESIRSKYGRRYAAQKAVVLAGRVQARNGDWAAAEKLFREAADLRKDSLLAGFALQEAAVAAEERRDTQAAIELWMKVVGLAGTVGVPHAHFALGSLYEDTKQYAQAKEQYDKLIAAYPENDWTKLARDRIILLKSQGLLP